jgi:hypothetical protein
MTTNPRNLQELADSLAASARYAEQRGAALVNQAQPASYQAGYAAASLDHRATVLAMIGAHLEVVHVSQDNPFGDPEAEHVLVIKALHDGTDFFSVVGDLREIRDLGDQSMNYLVSDAIHGQYEPIEGVLSLDPEYSAFYGYCATQEAAEALVERAEYLAHMIEVN